MVRYTRRHFQDTAGIIKQMPKAARKREVERWSQLFARDNPRFDRDKFSKAAEGRRVRWK